MRVRRIDLDPDIEERLAAGSPIYEQVEGAADLTIYYANSFTETHARAIEGRAVVRARTVFPGFMEWAKAGGHSLVPLDLTNGITVANALAAVTVDPFLPSGATRLLTGELGRVIQNHDRIGVVSLPRTGSKGLADQIILWGAPTVRVFHAHDLTPHREEQIANTADERSARVKAQGLRHIREMMAEPRGVLFISVERPEHDRVMSGFVMNHLDYLRSLDDMSEARPLLEKQVSKEMKRKSRFNEMLLQTLGVDLNIPEQFDGFRSYGGANRLIVIEIQNLSRLMRETGLDSSLVSSNSAIERGYGEVLAAAKERLSV